MEKYFYCSRKEGGKIPNKREMTLRTQVSIRKSKGKITGICTCRKFRKPSDNIFILRKSDLFDQI